MTVGKAIERADRLRPNTHIEEDKLHWASAAESHIVRHMNLHVGMDLEIKEFASPGDATALDGTDAELYVLYLVMMYDYYNGDYDRYNYGALQYNEHLQEWKSRYRREHMPKDAGKMRNLV